MQEIRRAMLLFLCFAEKPSSLETRNVTPTLFYATRALRVFAILASRLYSTTTFYQVANLQALTLVNEPSGKMASHLPQIGGIQVLHDPYTGSSVEYHVMMIAFLRPST
jgi:hypothetical protein